MKQTKPQKVKNNYLGSQNSNKNRTYTHPKKISQKKVLDSKKVYGNKSKKTTLRHHKKGKKIYKHLLTLLIIFILCTFLVSYLINKFEKEIKPIVISLANAYVNTLIDTQIENSLPKVVLENASENESFYKYEVDNEGYITFFEVNNYLVNTISTALRRDLNNSLENTVEKFFSINITEVLFTEYFSGIGPDYKIGVIPVAYSKVNYVTNYTTLGVNQTKFEISLEIVSDVKIISPLLDDTITVKRNIVLVDTIISGKVPSNFGVVGSSTN